MDNWPMKGGIVATDIGGTFTDLVAYDPSTGGATVAKVLTSSDLVGGINQAISSARIDLSDVAVFKHGTTTAINTVLEHTGAKTALVTTAGFRDALEIRRGNRTEPFNIFFKRWAPLVPRDLRFEIEERIDGRGRTIKPLEDSAIDDLISRLQEARCEAVATARKPNRRAVARRAGLLRDAISRVDERVSRVRAILHCSGERLRGSQGRKLRSTARFRFVV